MPVRSLPLVVAGGTVLLAAAGALAEPASPVRMNQLGFAPDAVKRAMVADASTAPLDWTLVDATGRTVASGRTSPFGPDRYSGEAVHRIDFSQVTQPGEGYRLIVGAVRSRAFAIRSRPYEQVKRDALSFFYHQRSGTPIEARFAGDAKWARPAGHLPDKATCFDATDQTGLKWPGCSYTVDATGGWYDAGDQGKYVVNGGISVWTLLNAYERAALTGTTPAFADRTQPVPEAGNGVNDLLDEARWELEWLLRMQAPDGARVAVPVGRQPKDGKPKLVEIDASGMAHHKLADERWTPLPTAPHEDRMRRYLYPPSTAATLNLAAVAAQGSRIWREIDPAFAARCRSAAERAWAAAVRNPEVYAWNGFDGSGGYGDETLGDEVYWAAAELYATTGEAKYLEAARRSPMWLKGPVDGAGEIAWPSVGALGTITLALVPKALSAEDRATAEAAVVKAANAYLADRAKVGYAIPYAPDGYPWGSTSAVLNRAMILGLAADFTDDGRYHAGVQDAADYIFGRNPLDQSFVSGWGARPLQHPHHRFWASQLDARYPPPPPGALSGGPNDTSMGDPVATKMKGSCAPQTCWADHIEAYTLNEVAVNWNAPLVWVTAWLDEAERAGRSPERAAGPTATAALAAAPTPGAASDGDVLKQRIDDPVKDRWAVQGHGQTTRVVKSPGVPGDYAMQVKVKTPGRNPWDVAAQAPISGAIKKGDVVLFAVWLRAVDGPGEVNLRVQQGDAPYEAVAETGVTLKREWSMVYVSGRSSLDLGPGKSGVAVHLGKAAQTVEVGPSMVLDFGPAYDMSRLPRNGG